MQLQSAPQGPVGRFLAVLGGIAVLALAATLGIVVLAVLLGLALIGALLIGIRTWWLRRQMRRAGGTSPNDGQRRRVGVVIEGDYHRSARSRSAQQPPDDASS